MSIRVRTLPLLLLAPLALALGCDGKDTDTAPVEVTCEGEANAGPDQSLTLGSTVTMDASQSALCEGVSYSYVWAFESVPVESAIDESLLTDNNSDTAHVTMFTPDVVGTYVVSLVLSDGNTETPADIVIVYVSSGNQAPVADCGGDLQVEVGERADLDGGGSYDPEGAELSYSWALATWPSESDLDAGGIFTADGSVATLIPDVSGTYLASLVVSDGEQWSEPVYCTVDASSENQAPIADAGQGGNKPPCTDNDLTLNGFGSYDPEGASLAYEWSVITVPAGSHADGSLDSGDTGPAGAPAFDDPTLANPTFTWDIHGSYTFQLNVFDGEFWSAPDVVTYTIIDRADNQAPTANAGEDQAFSGESECEMVSYGVHDCEGCPAEDLELDGSASEDLDGDELSYYWSEATGELAIHTPYANFTQVTTAVVPATVGSSSTTVYTVEFEVSDCESSDSDSLTITYSCDAEY